MARKNDTYTQAQELVRDVLSKFGQKVKAETVRAVAKKITASVPADSPEPTIKRAA